MAHDYNAPRRTNKSPIAKARIAKGWTQRQLGEAIGVDNTQIAKWERGERKPKLEALLKLGEALGVDWMTLIK